MSTRTRLIVQHTPRLSLPLQPQPSVGPGPGGLLLVFTIDSTSLFNRLGDVLQTVSGGRVARPVELLYDARHNYYFTAASLGRLLEDGGFRVERWRTDRAYLGRWLAEPAPWYLVAGGYVVDTLSLLLRLQYRRTAICRSQA